MFLASHFRSGATIAEFGKLSGALLQHVRDLDSVKVSLTLKDDCAMLRLAMPRVCCSQVHSIDPGNHLSCGPACCSTVNHAKPYTDRALRLQDLQRPALKGGPVCK